MAFLELGGREELENAIRKGIMLITVILCAFVAAGLLMHTVPPLVGFAIGGGVGGALGHFLSAIVLRMVHAVWPPTPK